MLVDNHILNYCRAVNLDGISKLPYNNGVNHNLINYYYYEMRQLNPAAKKSKKSKLKRILGLWPSPLLYGIL